MIASSSLLGQLPEPPYHYERGEEATVLFETDVDVLRTLLPPPLSVTDRGLMVLRAVTQQRSTLGPYKAAFLGVPVGADILFLRGLPRERVTAELTSTLGAPLLHAEVDAIGAADKQRVFDAGASYFHGLLPLLAAFSGFKDTIVSLKEGTRPAFDRDAWMVNRELLETLDLRGWSRAFHSPHAAADTTSS